MPSALFVQQNIGGPFRRHLLAGKSFMSALDEGEFHAATDLRRKKGLLSQAAPQQIGDHVLELPVLLDSADLYRTHYVIGQV
jgi:hypothetical protein